MFRETRNRLQSKNLVCETAELFQAFYAFLHDLQLSETGKLKNKFNDPVVRCVEVTRLEKEPGFWFGEFRIGQNQIRMRFGDKAFLGVSCVKLFDCLFTEEDLKQWCWPLYYWQPVNPWFWVNLGLVYEMEKKG